MQAWHEHGWEQARCLPAFYPNTCTARHCHVKVRLVRRTAPWSARSLVWSRKREPDSRIDGPIYY